MILVCLIAILLVAGALAAMAARWSAQWPRWIALAAVSIDFILGLAIWIRNLSRADLLRPNAWIEEFDRPWIPQFGIHLHLAMDGLSLLLVLLTFFLGIISVLASWSEIRRSVGFFHLNLMWILAGIVSVFVAIDLFAFYFAWELMLVPMYFLIAVWGHERRVYAAIKFFLFTQLSGLLMLIAILALYFRHGQATGLYTFDYMQLLGTPMDAGSATWMMLGFFVAFAVKLPMFPLHSWLPDAHTEAPTAGSIILAGLLLKTGGYGLLRFVVPLFPEASRDFAPVAMILAVIGILYGAILAYGQSDLKRLVAYTSVSHLGFVLLGIFVWNQLALQGAVMTMLCHGISTGALFFIVGALQDRMHTREIERMGGLWSTVPVLSGAGLFFALASLGLPGLGDFVGEFLVLFGTYPVHLGLTVASTIGVLAATFYALKIVQGAFHGPNRYGWSLPDLNGREAVAMAAMMASLLWLGLYPQTVLDTVGPYLQGALMIDAGDLIALLPLIVVAAGSVVVMLAIAIRRSHALAMGLTVVTLAAAFACLWMATSVAPRRVTALLIVDRYALFFMGLMIAATAAVAFIAYSYLEISGGRREELYLLLLVATLGSMVLVASSHFASFFLGLEVLTIALYALIAYLPMRRFPLEAGIKYLMLAAFSSAFLLLGMALVYAALGTMGLGALGTALAARADLNGTLIVAGLILIVTGIGFKLAVVPFHLWTPDVYQGAPAPVTAYVATVSKGAMFALLLRYYFLSGARNAGPVFLVFSIIAIASMLAGNLLALRQNNVKRILAYSSIAHLGYMLVAFLASGDLAVQAAAFYLVAYFVTTLGAFGVVSALSGREREAEDLEDYRGLFWRRPVLAGVFTAMLLSLAGIPLTAGFLAKFYIVSAGASSSRWVLVVILVITSGIGLYYYLRIIVAMYGGAVEVSQPPTPLPVSLVLGALTVLLVWFGVYPAPLLHAIRQAIVGSI